MAHGVADTTIDMVRERSQASIGSIYHHFGNKDQLAATLFLQGLQDYSSRLMAALADTPDAKSGVWAMVTTYIDWVVENPDWARFILHARHQVIRGDAEKALKEQNRSQFRAIKAWLDPFIRAGDIRPLPLELFHPLVNGPSQDYVRSWLAGRVQTSPQAYRDELAEAAWRALQNN